MQLFKTKFKDTVRACMDAFGCFFVNSIVKERKKEISAKIYLKQKISRPI